jgi:hypothetical protein
MELLNPVMEFLNPVLELLNPVMELLSQKTRKKHLDYLSNYEIFNNNFSRHLRSSGMLRSADL